MPPAHIGGESMKSGRVRMRVCAREKMIIKPQKKENSGKLPEKP